MSRPIEYKKELADEILNRMADGETQKSILMDTHLPTQHIWRMWINGENLAPPSLINKFIRARHIQADSFAADVITIADLVDDKALITAQAALDALPEDATATEKRRAFFYAKKRSVEGAKLSIDARKWSAARISPNKWGDKVTLEIGMDQKNPLQIDLTKLPIELLERVMALQVEVVEATGNVEVEVPAQLSSGEATGNVEVEVPAQLSSGEQAQVHRAWPL